MARRFQYPILAKPTTPPGQEAERVHPEVFQPPTNTPQSNQASKTKSTASFLSIVPSLFFVNIFPQITPVISGGDSVNISYPKVTQYQSQAFVPLITQAETVTIDKWYQRNPELLPPPKRILPYETIQPPSREALESEVSKYGWKKDEYDNPVLPRNNRWVFPSEFEPPSRTALEDEVSKYHWKPETPDNPFIAKKQTWTYQFFTADAQLFVVPSAEVITLDKYYQLPNQPLFKAPREAYFEAFVTDPLSLTRAEVITPDKWQSDTNKPYFDIRRVQWLYPPFTADAQLFNVPTPTEIITLDKWYQRTSEPVWVKKPLFYAFPLFSNDMELGNCIKYNRTTKQWEFTINGVRVGHITAAGFING